MRKSLRSYAVLRRPTGLPVMEGKSEEADDSAQYGDAETERFFMRTVFRPGAVTPAMDELVRRFAPIAAGCSVIMKPAEETPASALAVLALVYERLPAPGYRVAAIVACALCAVMLWPGVVKESDLDARPVNAFAAVGVLLTILLTDVVARAGFVLERLEV